MINVWKGEEPTKETWKVVETTLCLARSKWTNQVSSPPVEPVGNSAGLPVGARVKTVFHCALSKASQE